jgi:hypothetical protein
MITCPATGPVTVVVKLQTNCTAAWLGPSGSRGPGSQPQGGPWQTRPMLFAALLLLLAVGQAFLPVSSSAGQALSRLLKKIGLVALPRQGQTGQAGMPVPPRPGAGRWRIGVARLAPALVLLVAMVLPLCLAGCAVNNLPPALPNQPTTPAGTYPLVIVGTGPSGAKLMLTLTIKVI